MRYAKYFLVLFALGCTGFARADAVFSGIGSHASGFAATSVSADGGVVAGRIGFPLHASGAAATWSEQTGVSNLGFAVGRLPYWYYSWVAISADGTTLTGRSDGGAFRWTAQGGVELIYAGLSQGVSASSDGSVVLGFAANSGGGTFRWTAEGGALQMGTPAGTVAGMGFALSSDGTRAVVASSITGTGTSRVFRWTLDEGYEDTGITTFVGQSGNLLAISGDGSTLAASSRDQLATPGPLHVWREGVGVVNAGVLAGGLWAEPAAISTDGSVIVGASHTFAGSQAFLWREDLGMVNLHEHVSSLGIVLADWQLTFATGVSADGQTIVGMGRHFVNGQWHDQSWIVTIPAPSTAIAVACGCVLMPRRRRDPIK